MSFVDHPATFPRTGWISVPGGEADEIAAQADIPAPMPGIH